MSGKRHISVAASLGLATFSCLLIAVFLHFSSIDITHAQTTDNQPPAFERFKFSLTVDEGTPVGGAIGDPLAATDPDGDSLYFALTNGHTDLFSIDSSTGQVRAKVILNFETKEEEDYWLHVSVRDSKDAAGGRDLVADDQGLIVIQVANVEEPGTVSINWKRPWVSQELVANLTDPDGNVTGESWQWKQSNTLTGSYTSIPGETSNTYSPTSADAGKYLRVTVSYTDPQGSGKSAEFKFENPVTSVTAANRTLLKFSEGESTTRSVAENTPPGANIGGPIGASGGSGLLYTLSGTDASSFSINQATGQLQTKAPLDYEDKNSYSVSLQVTSSSGASDTIHVTINVSDKPVEINGPSRVEISEGDYVFSNVIHHYSILPGGADLTLTGTDARHFTLADSPGTGSQWHLTMNQEPDYEAPRDSGRNNVYNITINASEEIDGTTHRARLNVQVVVTNHNEDPEISGPVAVDFTEQTTGPVARYTARDPENDPIRWSVQDTDDWTFFQISRSGILSFSEPPDFENPGVAGNVYEVVILAQSGMNRATDGERVQVTVVDGADPPLFVQGYSEPRTISENAEKDTPIGQPVSAIGGPGATLTYTLRGTNARYFSINSTTGQLMTKTLLNYESRNSYSFTVRASDGSLSTDAAVAINVINQDEAGTVTFSTSQPRARIPLTASMTDPDGGIAGITWQWEKSSVQSIWTDIHGANSQSYTPEDGDVGNHLRATANYTDGHGAGKTAQAQSANAVGTGPNRLPSMLNTGTTIEVPENTLAGTEIGEPVTATDPDGDDLTYDLVGGNSTSFDIVASSGQLRTKAALNYEGKKTYAVVVRARDVFNAATNTTVKISVTNVDEAGTVTLSPSPPRVGGVVTASINDPDGGVSLGTATWQWRLAETESGAEQDISGATSRSYTPPVEQEGKYLRATATYTDAIGAGKTAQSDLLLIGAARAPRTSGSGNNDPNDDPNNGSDDGLNQPPNDGANPVITTSLSAMYSAAAYRVNEGSSVRVTVRLSTTTSQSVRIPVTIGRETAESGDYRVSGLSGGSLNFREGSRSASFTVSSLEDDDASNETINLGFGTLPSNIDAGSIPRASLTIVDDDRARLSVTYGAATYSVGEGSSIRVTVNLSSAATQALSIPISVTPGTAESGDYRVSGLSSNFLHFSQGSRSRSFTIVAHQDSDTDDETLNLAFGALSGGIAASSIPKANLTIVDDESVTIRLTYSSGTYQVNEGAAVQVTGYLTRAPASRLQVPVTINPGSAESDDYRASGLSAGSLDFRQGSSSSSFTITSMQDEDYDDETLFLGFGVLPQGVTAGSTPTANLTILDDEVPPPSQISIYYRSPRYAVFEGNSISVTVRLSAGSEKALQIPITTNGRSAEDGDYHLSGLKGGLLSFSPGERSRSFTFTALQDDDADDEQVGLGFGSLSPNIVADSRSGGTVTIEDDDPAPVLRKSVNGPPHFAEGPRTGRTLAEQARRGTPVGHPISAVDPDGDMLTYYLGGVDAKYFSVDSRTGQLQVWAPMDFELKSGYQVTLSVSDGHGGTDFITVSVNLTDIQEVSVTNPRAQSVGLATPGTSFTLNTADGVSAVHLPMESTRSPIFVRLESASVNCGGTWPAGDSFGLLTMQVFDTWGSPIDDPHMEESLLSLRFDAIALGGLEAVLVAHREGAIQVYRFRREAGDWALLDFAIDVDGLGVVSLTVGNLSSPSCLAALVTPAPREPGLPVAGSDPASGPNAGKAPGDDGRSRRAIPTPEPVAGTATDEQPPGSDFEAGPALIQAGIVADIPWWPRTFIILGTILLLAATGWQFVLANKDRRRLQKTFNRTPKQRARDITRI